MLIYACHVFILKLFCPLDSHAFIKTIEIACSLCTEKLWYVPKYSFPKRLMAFAWLQYSQNEILVKVAPKLLLALLVHF